MIERYIKQLEAALADTWYTLEDLYDPIRDAGLACTFDDLMDRHRATIESAKAEVPTAPPATSPALPIDAHPQPAERGER